MTEYEDLGYGKSFELPADVSQLLRDAYGRSSVTDEQALADLETLIATQQPASKPWEPVLDYSYEARKVVEGIHPQLIKDVFRPSYVLDAGCGRNAVLVRLLHEQGVRVAGIDPAFGAVDLLDRHGCGDGDITDRDIGWWGDVFQRFDLVICREVLEHLTLQQIRQAVTNLCALSSRFCYITTRFAKSPQHLLSVDTSDDLDPTHITMVSQPFLRMLFVLEGFRRRADLEAKMDHRGFNRVLVYERAA